MKELKQETDLKLSKKQLQNVINDLGTSSRGMK